MIAIDTNVALRLILNDDAQQVAAIERLMTEQTLYLPLTVVLETGWVLASRYAMDREQVAMALTALMTLDCIEIARADLMGWAIARFQAGADWADMIHLVAASKLGAFMTFDRQLVRHAGTDGPVTVRELA